MSTVATPVLKLTGIRRVKMERRISETRTCFRCRKPGHIKANCTATLPPPLPPLQLPPLSTIPLANDDVMFLQRVIKAAFTRYNNGEGSIGDFWTAVQAAQACLGPRRDIARGVAKVTC